MKWLDDKYLVIAVAAVIIIMLIGILFFYDKPHCEICGCVRFAKDCHSFCKPFGHEMSAVCQHVCVRPR